jgi:hypothetical protein
MVASSSMAIIQTICSQLVTDPGFALSALNTTALLVINPANVALAHGMEDRDQKLSDFR